MANKRATRSEWLSRVRAWKASGSSRAAFAHKEGCSATSLGWWAWRLNADGEDLTPKPVKRELQRVDFVELLAPVAEGSRVVLRVGGVQVEVGRDFDAETLGRLLDVLESRT